MLYEPSAYWSAVADRIRQRGGAEEVDLDLAGNAGPFHRYQRQLTLNRLSTLAVRGASVLELGSGPGGNLMHLSTMAPMRLIGCDIAPGMVQLSRERLGVLAKVIQLDGPLLPFDSESFDIAFTVTVLQHNPDDVARQLVKELCRVAETLELIEATTALRARSWAGSYFVRSTTDYLAWVTAEGFHVVDISPMNAWASEKAWLGIRRFASLIDRRQHLEGEAVSRVERAIDRTTLAVTRRIDDRLPMLSGLTAMRFQRIHR